MSDSIKEKLQLNQARIIEKLVREESEALRNKLAGEAFVLQKIIDHATEIQESKKNRKFKKQTKAQKRKAKKMSKKLEINFRKQDQERIIEGHKISGLDRIKYKEILVVTPGSGKKG